METESLLQMQNSLITASASLNMLKGQKTSLEKARLDYELRVQQIESFILTSEKVNIFIQSQIESQRRLLREKISGLVTFGIQVVFGPGISFVISEDESGRNDFKLDRKVGDVTVTEGIVGTSGGGLVKVICFLLNVVMLLLARPPRRKILILDEVWGAVDSEERSYKIKNLVEQLAEKTGIQFIISTHKPGITDCGDVRYHTTKDAHGYTKFERLNG